MSENGI